MYPDPPASDWDDCNLHVEWLGTKQTLCVPIPVSDASLLDLMPAARRLADAASVAAIEDAKTRGQTVSCGPGCGACCRQLVAISVVEAVALADLVASMAPERRATVRGRFAQIIQKLEENGLVDPAGKKGDRDLIARAPAGRRDIGCRDIADRYLALGMPCPLLENESCSVHADRPLVCREHHVTTPAQRCQSLLDGSEEAPVRLEPAVRIGEAMARTGDRVAGLGRWMIPLVLSLEWSELHAAKCRAIYRGLDLVRSFVSELDPGYREQAPGANESA